MRDSGKTLAFVAVNSKAAGVVALAGTVRQESQRTVRSLQEAGASPVLLTGDNQAAAKTIAGIVGIEEVVPSCKPEDKMRFIESCEEIQGENIHSAQPGGLAPPIKHAQYHAALKPIVPLAHAHTPSRQTYVKKFGYTVIFQHYL